jgi:peroxiredoxin Q/BCP
MTELKPGKTAPAFTGIDQNGKKVSLKDFRGRKVILYFYPKDDTPGCTAQACNLRDNYSELVDKGFEVIGISTDNVKSHKKFEKKFSLPFPLIADEDRKIVGKYGVWGEKKFMGRIFDGTHRTTYLIDERGKVKDIITKPDTKNQTQQALDLWNKDQP